MANKSSAYSIASRSRSESSTKTWLFNNLVSLLSLAAFAFLVLVISFESKMQKHKKLAKENATLQHKLSALRNGVSSLVKREVAKKQKAKVFTWKPIEGRCSRRGMKLDPFPNSFEPALYEELYGAGNDYHHYIEIGRKRGFVCTRGQRMKEVMNIEILPKFLNASRRDKGMILEIGPFLNPMLLGDDVKYFDVLDLVGLQERAKLVGYPEINPVKIDYVSRTGDLSVIGKSETFSLVASSNVLSHQVDLVRHLQMVEQLLMEGGYYALTVADKRYTFNHYLSETSISDVLDDYYENRLSASFHRMRSVIEHRALTVHNDVARHWREQSGVPYPTNYLERLQQSVNEFEQGLAEKKYIDVHNYHFTPQSLAFIVDTVYNLGLTNIRVHRLYETLEGQFEFGIVFKKCTPVVNIQSKIDAEIEHDLNAVVKSLVT